MPNLLAMTFEPVGATDTELVFCELLNRFVTLGTRTIGAST